MPPIGERSAGISLVDREHIAERAGLDHDPMLCLCKRQGEEEGQGEEQAGPHG